MRGGVSSKKAQGPPPGLIGEERENYSKENGVRSLRIRGRKALGGEETPAQPPGREEDEKK